MNRAIVIALAVTVAASAAAQTPVAPAPRPAVGEVSLLLVEEVPGKDGDAVAYRLVRVRLKQGAMQPPETVWEGDHSSNYLGEGVHLHLNRFVVHTRGGVIDVVAKKIIHPDPNGYGYVRGNRVVYRVDQEGAEQGVFAFDLVTHKVEKLSKVGDPKYDWTRLDHNRISPDGRRVVLGNGELTVYEPGQKPRPLGKGFYATGRTFGPLDNWWPVLWLDNDRILTQVRNDELVIVTLDGTRTPVVKIPVMDAKDQLRPMLDRNPDGRVSYRCGDLDFYIIDLDAKKWLRQEWRGFGHGFEIDFEPLTNPCEIRYRGVPIGRGWGEGIATEGYLVVPARGEVRIWSASTREWLKPNLHRAWPIGWMK